MFLEKITNAHVTQIQAEKHNPILPSIFMWRAHSWFCIETSKTKNSLFFISEAGMSIPSGSGNIYKINSLFQYNLLSTFCIQEMDYLSELFLHSRIDYYS